MSSSFHVTVTPMKQNVRDIYEPEIFMDYQKSVKYFKLLCHDLNLPTPKNIDNPPVDLGGRWAEITAGGEGFDYQIKMKTQIIISK